MINFLTIDLEDYYMVSAFEGVVNRDDWDKYESRIERNTHRLLDILNGSLRNLQSAIRNPVRATFFSLGWVAERYPHLIKEIHKQGHEIASHGYDHRLVYHMTHGQFREDVRKTKKELENIIGEKVIGYRAPSYSITRKSLWAINILAEEGYRYDSSIFPIHHDRYGIPDAPRYPFFFDLNGRKDLRLFPMEDLNGSGPSIRWLIDFRAPCGSSLSSFSGHGTSTCDLAPTTSQALSPLCLANGGDHFLAEIPASTTRLFGINIPIAGGGYFRLFPYSLFKNRIKSINGKEKMAFLFYLHPWELDPDQPRIQNGNFKSNFRHYVNLEKTEAKLKKLLEDFRFSSICDVLNGDTRIQKHLLPQTSSEAYAKRSSGLKLKWNQ